MSARVESLHLYPVKGFRAQDRATAEVALYGLAGDRRWMLIDPEGGFLTQRQVAQLAQIDADLLDDGLLLNHRGSQCRVRLPGPDAARLDVTIWGKTVPAVLAGPETDAWLTSVVGRPCRFAYMDDERARPVDTAFAQPGDHIGFADEYPLLATSHDSLGVLNDALASPVPMDRFRPNVTFSGLEPWAEHRWRRVRIGEMIFRAPKPCSRCIVITRDQQTGEAPVRGEPLRTLGLINQHDDGIMFGANLIPEAPGRLSVGDEIEVLETVT